MNEVDICSLIHGCCRSVSPAASAVKSDETERAPRCWPSAGKQDEPL
ncbi:hypothetical protein KCP76_21165 [Salmonella enterica subsp. enterica serovar Weltevreden]|nr:hypothetical protein KCP76_21165 [Salmonella enterica subsp. enterica serovar Weltevreden]